MVQSVLMWISQPDFQNQSITDGAGIFKCWLPSFPRWATEVTKFLSLCIWFLDWIHLSFESTVRVIPPFTRQLFLDFGTADPTGGDIFGSSNLKARTSLLPRFSKKRLSSFELWASKQHSKISPQVGLAVQNIFLVSMIRKVKSVQVGCSYPRCDCQSRSLEKNLGFPWRFVWVSPLLVRTLGKRAL